MTPRVDEAQRTKLNEVVSGCRDLLTVDLGGVLEGRFGVRPNGAVEAFSAMTTLDGSGHAVRRELIEILDHFVAEGENRRSARQRLVREVVFTHLNRLIAVRIAEALQLIPESIAEGRDSRGFRDLLRDVAPLLGADETGGYWTYLCLAGDELAADAPKLFDPRNPLVALAPSPGALDQIVAVLRPAYPGVAGGSLWAAADALGWSYQFFNDEQERQEMRKHAPRSSRELAVRNQFFTPHYVVQYLVHNTLGRRLVAADPASPLLGDLDWLIDPPTEVGPPIDLADVNVLDPACGSGHFLLGAYDVLELAWGHVGVAPDEAAARIVPALWGIDIDPRAAQVASAAIMLRARAACGRTGVLPRPNVICARELPPVPSEVEKDLPGPHRELLEELRHELARAPLLGSLLKIEGVLGSRVTGTATMSRAGMSPLAATDDASAEVDAVRAEVLAVVRRAAARAAASAAELLTAAEADDAMRFVEALSQRYDAVLMNPPFGEPAPATKPYLKAAYPWIPTKDHNLLAAFVGRGVELCDKHGYVGAITSRAGMFLTTFQAWRSQVLLGHRLVTLADLGFGVMTQALVEAAAYVIAPVKEDQYHPTTFFRLLREPAPTRGRALGEAVAAVQNGRSDDRVFRVAPVEFASIPGSPLAYWMPPTIRRLFHDLPPLDGTGGAVRQGLATGDDFRFVRAFWEVDPRHIAHDREATRKGKRWVPFAKGGEYSPYWSDIHLLVDWQDDGARIREYKGSRPQNTQYYFRSGLTWPLRTQAGFNPRVLPSGCAFGHKGPAILPKLRTSPLPLLAVLLSRVEIALLDTVATFGSYEVGAVSRLPWPSGQDEALHQVGEDVVEPICWHKIDADIADETTRRFIRPAVIESLQVAGPVADGVRLRRSVKLLLALAESESKVLDIFGLGAEARMFLDQEVGPLVLAVPLVDDHAEGRAEPPRWVDDELEEVGRKRGVSVVAAAQMLSEDRARQRRIGHEAAENVLSYLVGSAFGRWDVRIGTDPSLASAAGDLLDPPAPCSPGMLVDVDGLPTVDPGPDYPLSLPTDGVLVDEPGHRLDVVAAVEAAAAALVDEPSALLNELAEMLGRDLRGHLRRQFFRDHLSRYSKSRRKAPIYWPLYARSRTWGVWVYAHRLSRESLFSVEAAADQRLGSAITQIRRLEADQLGAGRLTPREVAQALEAERKLAEELRQFQREARRIAQTGWTPDLDDGITLCAAPLVDLFPDWETELASRRNEIKRGDHPWAAVHQHRAAL